MSSQEKLFTKEDLKKAWLHGELRVPEELKHCNNFEVYFKNIITGSQTTKNEDNSSLADGVKLLLNKVLFKLPDQEFDFTLAEANDLSPWTNADFYIKNDLVEYRLLPEETTKNDDTAADFSTAEITALIAKVHDDMEGRYDLTGEDLFNIHAALCKLQ